MSTEQIIKCVFCQGTGNNPHFRGTCPVCKGKGKNEVVGKYMTCSSCHGSGQKGGTTLTCYDCRGLGVVPDTREIFKKAREEIREAQEEMARERDTSRYPSGYRKEELTEKPMIKITPALPAGRQKNKKHKLSNETHFCQCCGDEVTESVTVKICLGCFSKVKELRGYKEI